MLCTHKCIYNFIHYISSIIVSYMYGKYIRQWWNASFYTLYFQYLNICILIWTWCKVSVGFLHVFSVHLSTYILICTLLNPINTDNRLWTLFWMFLSMYNKELMLNEYIYSKKFYWKVCIHVYVWTIYSVCIQCRGICHCLRIFYSYIIPCWYVSISI